MAALSLLSWVVPSSPVADQRVSRGKLILLWIFFFLPLASSKDDVEVSCVIGLSCIFPCSFDVAGEVIIHWIQLNSVGARAHSFYYDENQLSLQHSRFKDRTSLFDNQISHGNASLLLTDVNVQDGGRYKCYTSTTIGYKDNIVNVKVNALVGHVSVSSTEEGVTCSSQGVYPQPELTWSTQPPSTALDNLSSTDITVREEGLYDVSSSLRLPLNYNSVSCSVHSRGNARKTTLMRPTEVQVSSSTAQLSCPRPAAPLTALTWTFNHRPILSWSLAPRWHSVSEEWKLHLKLEEELGEEPMVTSLMLKELSSQHEGTYVCEVSTAEKTLRTETTVKMDSGNQLNVVAAVVGVLALVALVALAATVGILVIRRRQRQQEKKPREVDGKSTLEPLNTKSQQP